MNLKALLVLLIAILYMLGAQWWYATEKAPNYCCGKETVAPPSDASGDGTIGKAAAMGPLLFNWTSATPITSDKFTAYKKGILDEKGNILLITGKYYEGEKAPKGYENMGLARAAETRKLFPEIPDARIELAAQKMAKPANLDTSLAFPSANINWKSTAALGPLLFNWTNAMPIISDKFAAYKKGIMNGDEKENILVITGKYYEGEKAPKGYENMGLARAAEIRKLFPAVPDTRIELESQLVPKPANLDPALAFPSANINWKAAPVKEKAVIELANKALIYFPYRQSSKEVDAKVDEYLRKLAERLKSGNEKVIITGHTDDRGDADANLKLGERRAKNVRDILERLGVPANRMTTLSKGETEPAEPNGTERGWRLNRRTVVEVVQ